MVRLPQTQSRPRTQHARNIVTTQRRRTLLSFLRSVPHFCELLLLAAWFSSGESNPSSDSSKRISGGSLQAISTDTIRPRLRSEVPVQFHISGELAADFVARIAGNDTTPLANVVSPSDAAISQWRRFCDSRPSANTCHRFHTSHLNGD